MQAMVRLCWDLPASPILRCKNWILKVRRLWNPMSSEAPNRRGRKASLIRYLDASCIQCGFLVDPARDQPWPGTLRVSQFSIQDRGPTWNIWFWLLKVQTEGLSKEPAKTLCFQCYSPAECPLEIPLYAWAVSKRTWEPAPPFPTWLSETLYPRPIAPAIPSVPRWAKLSYTTSFPRVVAFCTRHTPHHCPPNPFN